MTVLKEAKGEGIWAYSTENKLYKLIGDSVAYEKDFKLAFKHLCETPDGNLLVLANDQDLLVWDIKQNSKRELGAKDGLLKKEIKGIAISNNHLLVVNPDCIQKLKIHTFDKSANPPKLSLKSILINNQAVDSSLLQNLNHQENNLEFKFKTLHLNSFNQEYLVYRLGSEAAWRTNKKGNNDIEFLKLSPGEYELEIKACSAEKAYSDPIKISFVVHKAWFKTTWFYLGLFLLLLGVVFFVSKAIIKQNLYLEKLERDKEMAEKERQLLKIKAIQSQMNPHFVFNALNSIQDYILSNQKALASEYLADFADLISSYLKQTKQDFIEIEEEANTLKEYLKLEKLRLGGDLQFDILYEGDEEAIKSKEIPVMLIQPFVENAIKHGLLPKKQDRNLIIKFTLNQEKLSISIQDDRVGMKAAATNPQKKAFPLATKPFKTK